MAKSRAERKTSVRNIKVGWIGSGPILELMGFSPFDPPMFCLITLAFSNLPEKFMMLLFLHPIYQTDIFQENKPLIW